MAEHATQTPARQNAQNAAGSQQPSEVSTRQNVRPDSGWYELQKALGNQVMQRSLLAGQSGIPGLQRKCASCEQEYDDELAGVIQTKLTVNQPGDVYEQEADRIADAVMQWPGIGNVGRTSVSEKICPGGTPPGRLQRQPRRAASSPATTTDAGASSPAPDAGPAAPIFVCGPDVTTQVSDVMSVARSAWSGWSTTQRNEACWALESFDCGPDAWDIVQLHNNAWIYQDYRPTCASEKANPHCGSSVKVGPDCHNAGSVNYVVFGLMCELCNISPATMRLMIRVHKTHLSGMDPDFQPSVAWAEAGRAGWPAGTTPSGDRNNCAPTCATSYGPTAHNPSTKFDFHWFPTHQTETVGPSCDQALAGQRAEESAPSSAELDDSAPAIVQRTCACGGTCDDCQRKVDVAQRATPRSVSGVTTAPPVVHDVLRSQGKPLDTAARAFMELRFGSDFGSVRVHADSQAAESARAISASAYTVGNAIVFGSGQYSPGTSEGRRLLAHELTHVVQQTKLQAPSAASGQPKIQRQNNPSKAPANGAWDNLPESARKVLQHSFDTRDPAKCGTPSNVEWMWCGATAADSYNHLDSDRQEAFRSVQEALEAARLWHLVARVVEVHSGATRGIKGLSTSTLELLGELDGNPRLCRDTALGGMLHPNETTWREVVAGAEGLHIGSSGKNLMSAHLDASAPVAEREADGRCRYSMPHLFPHFSRDVMGWRNFELFPVPTEEPKPGDVQPLFEVAIPGT
jgi:hypothetical protein